VAYSDKDYISAMDEYASAFNAANGCECRIQRLGFRVRVTSESREYYGPYQLKPLRAMAATLRARAARQAQNKEG